MAAQLDIWYNHVIAVSKECGEVIKEAIDGMKDVDTKLGNWDLVTEYDKRVEELLIGGIREKFPDHKFIAEEATCSSHVKPTLTDAPTWIIDPIDGTTNFVHGFSLCCISIALAVNKTLVIGIVYNPVLNELYTAKKGQGAFLNGRRINCSKVQDIEVAMVAHETSFARIDKQKEILLGRFRAMVSVAQGIRILGSAALALAYVARGTLDAYHIDNLYPWDISAGALIIKEAGGCVIDTTGKEFNIMKPNVIGASSEKLAKTLVQVIRRADEDTYHRLNNIVNSKNLTNFEKTINKVPLYQNY